MDLAKHQRSMRDILKSSPSPWADDDYFQVVAHSPHLALVQEIVAWWRILQVGNYCVLTSHLLKQRGLFDATVERVFASREASPFIEALSIAFLESLACAEDSLVRSVAQFELALTHLRIGVHQTYIVAWDFAPDQILDRLANNLPVHESDAHGRYQTRLSPDSTYGFTLCIEPTN